VKINDKQYSVPVFRLRGLAREAFQKRPLANAVEARRLRSDRGASSGQNRRRRNVADAPSSKVTASSRNFRRRRVPVYDAAGWFDVPSYRREATGPDAEQCDWLTIIDLGYGIKFVTVLDRSTAVCAQRLRQAWA